jgi:hypothetical protein
MLADKERKPLAGLTVVAEWWRVHMPGVVEARRTSAEVPSRYPIALQWREAAAGVTLRMMRSAVREPIPLEELAWWVLVPRFRAAGERLPQVERARVVALTQAVPASVVWVAMCTAPVVEVDITAAALHMHAVPGEVLVGPRAL